MDSRSRSQFGVEFVWLTTEQQDRILGDIEHPAIQIENGRRERTKVEPALQRDQLAMPRQKKLKAFKF